MVTEPADLLEEALALFRRGEDRAALEAARALLEVAPHHAGGTMLYLAASGGAGDELAIELGLRALLGRLEQLLAAPAIPEGAQPGTGDLPAPAVRDASVERALGNINPWRTATRAAAR